MSLIVLAALLAFCVVVYLALFNFGNAYSIRSGWQTPQGTEATDWTLRRNVAFTLGLISTILCAIGCWLWLPNLTSQLVATAEGALLAAAGASDLRRFHLPLPFTMGGIVIAIAVAFAVQTPLFVMLFALGWAIALILLHSVVSKGSMQLGDHIATIWIALALPFNGMLALLAGDIANIILARVKGLKGKKVAAAGAWLVVCAALVGVPPYVTWREQHLGSVPIIQTAQEVCTWTQRLVVDDCQEPIAISRVGAASIAGAQAASNARWQTKATGALIKLTAWAGEETGRVILSTPGSARVDAARKASLIVAQYATLARQIAVGKDVEVAEALDDLAVALSLYDVDGVGSASLRLLDERTRLEALVALSSASVAPSLLEASQ